MRKKLPTFSGWTEDTPIKIDHVYISHGREVYVGGIRMVASYQLRIFTSEFKENTANGVPVLPERKVVNNLLQVTCFKKTFTSTLWCMEGHSTNPCHEVSNFRISLFLLKQDFCTALARML